VLAQHRTIPPNLTLPVAAAPVVEAWAVDRGTVVAHGSPEQDEKRKALNTFIRASGVFDSVIEFDGVTADPATGQLKPEFVHNTTTGGDGDKLHPNRLGYIAMGMAIDLDLMRPLR